MVKLNVKRAPVMSMFIEILPLFIVFLKLTFILAKGWLFSLFSSSILSDVPKLVSRTGRGKTYTDELLVDSVLGLKKKLDKTFNSYRYYYLAVALEETFDIESMNASRSVFISDDIRPATFFNSEYFFFIFSKSDWSISFSSLTEPSK